MLKVPGVSTETGVMRLPLQKFMAIKNVLSGVMTIVLLMLGCTTTQPAKPKAKAPKKPLSCYCGMIQSDASGEELCAIWQEKWTKKERQRAIATGDDDTCGVADCKALTTDNPCTEYKVWAAPPKKDIAEPCFCDRVTIYGNPMGDQACATWRASDGDLLEYHFTPQCEPADCKKAPFVYSKTYCQNQFQKHYPE